MANYITDVHVCIDMIIMDNMIFHTHVILHNIPPNTGFFRLNIPNSILDLFVSYDIENLFLVLFFTQHKMIIANSTQSITASKKPPTHTAIR